MNLKVKNITNRIKELNTEIFKLEQRLAAMNWEREKYLQFSYNTKDNISSNSTK